LTEEVEERAAPLMQVGAESEWIRVEATMDSGSAEHVLPAGWLEKLPMEESAGSRTGKKYLAASGEKVPNMGEKTVEAITNEGMRLKIIFQVTKVVKALISVGKLTRQGHRVVLDRDWPCIITKGGSVTQLRLENGVFVVDLWVHKRFGTVEADFQRR
jgi:hypothetical protein